MRNYININLKMITPCQEQSEIFSNCIHQYTADSQNDKFFRGHGIKVNGPEQPYEQRLGYMPIFPNELSNYSTKNDNLNIMIKNAN